MSRKGQIEKQRLEEKISNLESTVKSLERNSRLLANKYSVAIETIRSLKEVIDHKEENGVCKITVKCKVGMRGRKAVR